MHIYAPPIFTDFDELSDWCYLLWSVLGKDAINASTTWNPGSIADGGMEAKDVTVTGAELGDHVLVSFSLDVADLTLTANVTAANTVTCVLANSTGGAVDLAEGTLYIRLLKRTT